MLSSVLALPRIYRQDSIQEFAVCVRLDFTKIILAEMLSNGLSRSGNGTMQFSLYVGRELDKIRWHFLSVFYRGLLKVMIWASRLIFNKYVNRSSELIFSLALVAYFKNNGYTFLHSLSMFLMSIEMSQSILALGSSYFLLNVQYS